MTTPESYGQFGQTLALAERTLTEGLRRHLSGCGVVPETWYALKLIATGGPGFPRQALFEDLARSRSLDPASTGQLLARLQAEGLLRGESAVDLTEQGEALYRRLSESVSRLTAERLSRFDVDDIDTTVRTLQAITKDAVAALTVTSS